MNFDLIEDIFVCPVCRAGLLPDVSRKTLRCRAERPHCFDVAAAGYINLAGPRQSGAGDSSELVRARNAFLSAGHYEPFAGEVCKTLKKYTGGGRAVVDAGCGVGYYTIRAAAAAGCGICGFDLSKPAVQAAARASRPAGSNAVFCVAGIFDMPLRESCADVVMNFFAPCAEDEFLRILKPGGYLIVAGAGAGHLYGLKSAIYDTPIKNTPRADLPQKMKLIGNTKVSFELKLRTHGEVAALFSMTPYYYRTKKTGFDRLAELSELDDTADIDLSVYKKEL